MQTSILYTLPYIGLVIYMICLMVAEEHFKSNERDRQLLLLFAICGMALMAGLKGYSGCDVLLYKPVFDHLPTFAEMHRYETDDYMEYERGFTYFMMLVKSLGGNYWVFNFINSVIDACLLYVIIKREKPSSYVGFLLIYWVWCGYLYQFEQIRNAKNILCFLLSLSYVREGRFFPFLALNLIGLQFHNTSLILIACYPILRMKMTYMQRLAVVAVVFVVFLFHIRFIDFIMQILFVYGGDAVQGKIADYYGSRADSWMPDYHWGIKRIIAFAFALAFFVFPRRCKLEGKEDNVVLNMFLIYFVIFFSCCELNVLCDRGSQMFALAFPFMFLTVMENLPMKIYRQCFFVAFMALYPIFHAANTYKYKNFVYSFCFTACDSEENNLVKVYLAFMEKDTKKTRSISGTSRNKLDQFEKNAKSVGNTREKLKKKNRKEGQTEKIEVEKKAWEESLSEGMNRKTKL